MTLSRIAWLVTVGTCLIGAVLLFVAGYQGYGVLALFVGAAAAINVAAERSTVTWRGSRRLGVDDDLGERGHLGLRSRLHRRRDLVCLAERL